MLQEMKKRVCPHTQLEFVPKRSNQLFFDRQCRIDYHNNINNTIRKKTAYINSPLMKNRKIFSELLANKNEGVFHNQFLIGKGVSFEVFTHLEEYKEGIIAYSVFEFWYYKVDEKNIKVIRYDRRK